MRTLECPGIFGLSDSALSLDERYLAQAYVGKDKYGNAAETIRVFDVAVACIAQQGGKHDGSQEPPDSSLYVNPPMFGLHFTFDNELIVYSDVAALRVIHANPLSQVFRLEVEIPDRLAVVKHAATARDAYVAAVLVTPAALPREQGEPKLRQRPPFEYLFRAYDLHTGNVKCDVKLPNGSTPLGLALSPDGKRAAITLDNSGQILKKGPNLWMVDIATCASGEAQHFSIETVGEISFADNDTLVTRARIGNGEKRVLRVLDANTGNVEREIAAPHDDDAFSALVPGDGGRYVAAPLHRASEDMGAFLNDEFGVWDVTTGQLVARFKTRPTRGAHLSRTGRFLITGSRIYELALP